MHARDYLRTTAEIALEIDPIQIEAMASALHAVQGRIYVAGIGGSLANALHMAADLRKLCGKDALSPNMAEWTARANDEGLSTTFAGWMSHMGTEDALFVLSVGGGTAVVSTGLVAAVDHARSRGARVYGIVGPAGGYTAQHADLCIKVPAPQSAMTPHTEAFQIVIIHCLVSHPLLQKVATKW